MVILVQNSSKILKYNVTEIPVSTAIAVAYFTLKTAPTIADAEAEIFKTITSTITDEGQILDDGATDHAGVLEFYIGPSDTELLETNRYYYVCVKVKLDNDEFYILEESIDSCRIKAFGIAKDS